MGIRIALAIRQFEIVDCVHTSRFRKLLCLHQEASSNSAGASSSIGAAAHMIIFCMTSIRPENSDQHVDIAHTEEWRIEVSLLPWKVNAGTPCYPFQYYF